MLQPEHLAYFKDLFEGRAEVSWNAWFKQNAEQLAQLLPRGEFLRLKFQKLDEAERLLKQAGVDYAPSPMLKREKLYSLLHESVLDEKGRPKEGYDRGHYNGAFGHFYDGNMEKGNAILAKCLKNILRRPQIKRAEELGDMCFDGEMELEYGNKQIALAILGLLAALPTGDDLLDPAIFRARRLLNLD